MLNFKRKHLILSLLAATALTSGLVVADPTQPGAVTDPATATVTTDDTGSDAEATPAASAVVAAPVVVAPPAPIQQPVTYTVPVEQARAMQGYAPSVITLSQAKALYEYAAYLNVTNHKSQCHERAEFWTDAIYENYRRVNMMKVMMYYTPRFRDMFRHDDGIYKWWYHTAPLVYVKGNDGVIRPYIIDPEFVDSLVTLEEWEHFFLHDEMVPNGRGIPYASPRNGHQLDWNETRCQLITNFRQYAIPALRTQFKSDDSLYQPIRTTDPWCQVRIYPMYYMTPADVANLDCDESQDADYTLGLTGKRKLFWHVSVDVLHKRNENGGYKYICKQRTSNFFSNDGGFKDLDIARGAVDAKPGKNSSHPYIPAWPQN